MDQAFIFPPVIENGPRPLWTGKRFQLGNEQTKVLHYSSNNAGWNVNVQLNTPFIGREIVRNYFFQKS